MTKLTMVSYNFRGVQYSWFIPLPVDADGRVRIPQKLEDRLIKQICPEPGHTIWCH